MLTLIACRNLLEIVGSDVAFYPTNFFQKNGILKTILSVSVASTCFSSRVQGCVLIIFLALLFTACLGRHHVGDGGGLAQAWLHYQV